MQRCRACGVIFAWNQTHKCRGKRKRTRRFEVEWFNRGRHVWVAYGDAKTRKVDRFSTRDIARRAADRLRLQSGVATRVVPAGAR